MKTPLDVDARVGDIADPHSKKREELRRAQKRAEMDALSREDIHKELSGMSATTLRDMEETGNRIASGYTQQTRQSQQYSSRTKGMSRYLERLTKIKLKGKSSMLAIILAVLFGGGFLTVLFSPSLAIVEMKEVLTHALNDQLHAVDSRSKSLFKATMKGPASCGAVKICKKFSTMSTAEVKEFEKNNSKIKIDRDMVDAENGRVKNISFTNDAGEKLSITNEAEMQNALKNNVEFKAAWTKGYNPQFKSLSDSLVQKVLFKLKATKNQDISGKNDEERQKKLNQASGGLQESGAKPLFEKTDENGKKTYVDENGNPLSKEQVNAAKEMEKRIEGYATSGGTAGVLKRAAGSAVMITGTADTACSVFNGIRHVSALAKDVKKAQMARYALALVLTPADRIKAGDASEGETNFVGNTLMATAAPTKVIDESKLSQSGNKIPTTMSGDIGNAFDSKGYKLASGEKIGKLSTNDARFSLGGVGSTRVLDTITTRIAQLVNGGNSNPKALSKKCGYIQSWFVRGGALAVGIVTGVASLGLSTLVIGGASFALQLATPLIESSLADIIAGNVTKDISGYDSGNAVYSGTAGMLGDIAENRGMAPVTTQGGADYLAENRQTTAQYASLEHYMARTTPFDISNQYSFMGSIISSLIPIAQQSRTSVSMAAMNIASLVPRSFASMLQPEASALSSDYFGQCGDMTYNSLGIQAGPFCEVRHWMSNKELAMDPAQNAVWMAQTGNIDPTSDSGIAKDNGEDWNYVKFLDECAHRTAGWGEPQNDEGSGDGSDCLNPAYESMNEHFRVYTMDQSLKASMTETDSSQQNLPGTTGFADGQTGTVSSDGWAFPTAKDDVVTFGYQPGHEGVDIAGKDATTTIGQPIFAAFDGRVAAAGPSQSYGNWIVLVHDVKGKTMSTIYAYMQADGVLVHVGDTVKAGQEIGRIGSNGSGNRPYLYFELWQGQALGNGTRIDPTEILDKAKGAASA